jgi:hypothetical protein
VILFLKKISIDGFQYDSGKSEMPFLSTSIALHKCQYRTFQKVLVNSDCHRRNKLYKINMIKYDGLASRAFGNNLNAHNIYIKK